MNSQQRAKQIGEHVEKLSILTRAKAFLGREFLTWLWCQAETKKGTIRLENWDDGKARDIEIWMDDLVSMESSSSRIHEHRMKGGDPCHSQEATVALAGGKMVKDIKVGMRIPDVGEFSVVLQAADLSPRSLRLPDHAEMPSEDADETAVHKRLKLTQLFLRTFDGLFAAFLEERATEKWQKAGLPALNSWVEQRRRDHEVKVLH